MGVGRRNSLAGFAARAQSFAIVGLPTGAYQGVEKAALVATTAARASIAVGSGGDSVMSNVGRGAKGAKVGVRYDIKGAQNPTALIRATGPLHILDNPTSPHQIMSKVKKGRSRASRGAFYNALFGGDGGFGAAKPLRTPYGPRYRVQHPGTKGKRTFWRAIDNVRPLIPITFRTEVARQMSRSFG
jgi:hypothetical protein